MGFNSMVLLDELVKNNIITLDRGRVISTIDLANKPGIYPVYSSSSQNEGLFGTFDLFDFDEELITWSVDGGGYFFHRPKHRFSVTNVSGILRILQPQKIDYKFLYFLLAYQHSTKLFDYVDKAHPSVIRKQYFIPKIDILEQNKIAEILSRIDKAVAQTEALIKKYIRIKTGLMQDLLTKGIDEQGNIRSEATHEFRDSLLGRIPKEWKVINLGKISVISSGVTLGKKYQGLGTDLFPYLRVANVQDGYLDLGEIKYIRVPVSFLSKYKLQKGDVLMNEGGDYDKLGRGTTWNDELTNCLHQNHVFKVRPDKSILNSTYLAFYSASSYGKSFFLLASKQSTNLASINKTQLQDFPILLPKIEEQGRILDILAKQTETGNQYNTELNKLQSLKTGLMQDLLSGKVRVNHLLKKENRIT